VKLHRYCPTCDVYTHVKTGKVCKNCGKDFSEKEKVAKSINESVLTLDDPYTRQCSDFACGALTRGNRCTVCRVCGKRLLRKEKAKPEKKVVEPKTRVYTPEEIEAAKTKKLCECGAYTPGYASKHCWACGKVFPKKVKEVKEEKVEVQPEVQDFHKAELQYQSEKWEYPTRYIFPTFLRSENMTFCEYPCPKLEYKGDFPEDHEVIEWAHDTRQHLLTFRSVYANNGCLFYYLRSQFKGKFAEQSDEMLYLRMLIEGLPDLKRRPPNTAAA
jgi:hypothetical protein